MKKVPKDGNGKKKDSVDPFGREEAHDNQGQLAKDWKSFDLDKCLILPSKSKKKKFKLIIDRSE